MYGRRVSELLPLFALLLTACAFKPNLGDGQVRCGSDGRCPPGQQCSDDGICYKAPATAGGTCIATHCFVGWCGAVPDGCGEMLDCGPCQTTSVDASVSLDLAGCVASVACEPGRSCGKIDDGCGRLLDCGDCPMPGTCSATEPNRCGCTPKTCAEVGASCGSYPDGCGGIDNCFPGGAAKCAA